MRPNGMVANQTTAIVSRKSNSHSQVIGKVSCKVEFSPMRNKVDNAKYLKDWQKSANLFLSHKRWGSSPLEAAEIALRSVDPKLAERCAREAVRRRKRQP